MTQQTADALPDALATRPMPALQVKGRHEAVPVAAWPSTPAGGPPPLPDLS
jgi:hypothetical protein